MIVNDRVDVAIVAGTRHVHLGQDDLPVPAARALLGPDAVIGLSTHTPAQVDAACTLPIDYVAVGPVFGTQTKATGYDAGRHDAGVRRRARRRRTPRRSACWWPSAASRSSTAPDVIAAGADAVVVISDLLTGGAPGARARAFLRAVGEA